MIFFVTVLVLPLMLVLSGLAIDLAALGTARDRAQVASDAAATAGASSIRFQKFDPDCVKDCGGIWILPSMNTVITYAEQNGFSDPTVVFSPAEPSVTVTVTGSSPTSFLRLLGFNRFDTIAMAKAIRTNVSQEEKDAANPTPGHSRLVQ